MYLSPLLQQYLASLSPMSPTGQPNMGTQPMGTGAPQSPQGPMGSPMGGMGAAPQMPAMQPRMGGGAPFMPQMSGPQQGPQANPMGSLIGPLLGRYMQNQRPAGAAPVNAPAAAPDWSWLSRLFGGGGNAGANPSGSPTGYSGGGSVY